MGSKYRFRKGDTAICTNADGILNTLTVGKEYEILDRSRNHSGTEMVKLIADHGGSTRCDASRFKVKEVHSKEEFWIEEEYWTSSQLLLVASELSTNLHKLETKLNKALYREQSLKAQVKESQIELGHSKAREEVLTKDRDAVTKERDVWEKRAESCASQIRKLKSELTNAKEVRPKNIDLSTSVRLPKPKEGKKYVQVIESVFRNFSLENIESMPFSEQLLFVIQLMSIKEQLNE
jgi:hypothetical protein